jgi:UTP--glucose-1-phosphate uridylyltransferase
MLPSITAILPAGGRGSRMVDLTGGNAKELIDLGGRPILQWVIDEARGAPVSSIIAVSSPLKPDLTEFLRRSEPDVTVVMQDPPRGLAPAIACAGAASPVLICLPDTVFLPQSPARRLIEALETGADIVIAAQEVPPEMIPKFGILDWDPQTQVIKAIHEKPKLEDAPSRWAVAGRLALSLEAYEFIRDLSDLALEKTSELYLSPILNRAISAGFWSVGLPLLPEERRLDCGDPAGLVTAREVLERGL